MVFKHACRGKLNEKLLSRYIHRALIKVVPRGRKETWEG
jgi:hypothetical protein